MPDPVIKRYKPNQLVSSTKWTCKVYLMRYVSFLLSKKLQHQNTVNVQTWHFWFCIYISGHLKFNKNWNLIAKYVWHIYIYIYLNVHIENRKSRFRKRGYPYYLIKEQVEKVLRLSPSDENNSKKVNEVPLVVTYNPAFKNLFQVIRKNLQLLYADEQVKKVFSPAPFVSFRSTRNLKSYLLRSKIYALERKSCFWKV